MHRIENDTSVNPSVVAFAFIAAGNYLPSRCLAKIGGIHTQTHGKATSSLHLFFRNRASRLKHFDLSAHIQ
jgi:hypothetical protein